MNEEEINILSWLSARSKDERVRFLKKLLDVLPEVELENVSNLVSKAKKRRIRSGHRIPRRPTTQINEAAVPAADVAVLAAEGAVSAVEVAVSAPDVSVSVPVASLSVDTLPVIEPPCLGTIFMSKSWNIEKKKEPWWGKYVGLENIIGLDIEKVEYPNKSGGKPKFILKAATVTAVNGWGETVKDWKIKHLPGSFRINPANKTGFKKGDFLNGISMEIFKKDFFEFMDDKLIVLVDAVNDFISMDLAIGQFDVFDLQDQWFSYGLSGRQKIGLRSLCHHFFNGIDMQPPNEFHTAENDAYWTVSLFTFIYMNLPPTCDRFNDEASAIISFKPEKVPCVCKFCK